tara:strand:- start:189 stop:686 length:498 start_codon:yes stop_codon:yes gene_type:complete
VNDVTFNSDVILAGSIFHEGDLDTKIQFDADTVTISAGGDTQLICGASTTFLYHNGNEKLKTDASGVFVTGNTYVSDSIVHTDDTDTKIDFTADNIALKTQGESKIFIGTASVILYYDSNQKLETVTGGISVTGNVVTSGSSVCANGIECRLRVLDESGNALNTC